jgi:phosphatidylserine/phosphatidylglycerophosphate/cardiolipin synthase-like enzyme
MIDAIVGSEFVEKVIPLIENAKDNIKIVVFDWRVYPTFDRGPVRDFNRAIFAAAKRGVKVQALVNNDLILSALKENGVEAKRLYSKKLLHTKLILIDDDFAILGSHNYTQNAFERNMELSAIIPLDKTNNLFHNFFQKIWPL